MENIQPGFNVVVNFEADNVTKRRIIDGWLGPYVDFVHRRSSNLNMHNLLIAQRAFDTDFRERSLWHGRDCWGQVWTHIDDKFAQTVYGDLFFFGDKNYFGMVCSPYDGTIVDKHNNVYRINKSIDISLLDEHITRKRTTKVSGKADIIINQRNRLTLRKWNVMK